jgi:uroporphyrinogen decarboxylase
MDSRERVHRAIRRERPDRPARDIWLLPATEPALGPDFTALLERWPIDFAKTGFCQWPDDGDKFRVGESRDHWGSIWSNVNDGLLGIVTGFPLDGDHVSDDWQPPFDAIGPATENLPKQIEAMSGDKFRLGGGIELFHRMCWLRPMDRILMDLLLSPESFQNLLQPVVRFFDALLERLLPLDLDAVLLVDDWGTQRQLFISPDDWRKYFKPHYSRWARECHRAGKMCLMHSDGHILPILPDLAEIGIDAINCEVDCMGIESVAEARGSLCLWGEVDRQNLLPRGTPEQVAAAARRYLEVLGWPEGGFILQSEIGPDVPLANVEALLGQWGMR